jgi:hypothetical protein
MLLFGSVNLKKHIASKAPHFFMIIFQRNRRYIEDISYGLYLYTFYVCHYDGKKHYPANLLIEAMYQYGNGSKNINHKGFPLAEEGFLNL